MKEKTTHATLVPSIFPGQYVIKSLRNTARLSVGKRFFRVGDTVTYEETDTLCDTRPDLEITILNK